MLRKLRVANTQKWSKWALKTDQSTTSHPMDFENKFTEKITSIKNHHIFRFKVSRVIVSGYFHIEKYLISVITLMRYFSMWKYPETITRETLKRKIWWFLIDVIFSVNLFSKSIGCDVVLWSVFKAHFDHFCVFATRSLRNKRMN